MPAAKIGVTDGPRVSVIAEVGLNGGVDMNRQAAGRDIPGQMRAKQVRAWRQRTEFEPAILIRYCDRRRRPKSGNDDVRDRLTAVVFHGAGDGAGCLRCTYRPAGKLARFAPKRAVVRRVRSDCRLSPTPQVWLPVPY